MTATQNMIFGWLILTGIVFLVTRSVKWVIWMMTIVLAFWLDISRPRDQGTQLLIGLWLLFWVPTTFIASVYSVIRWMTKKPPPKKVAT